MSRVLCAALALGAILAVPPSRLAAASPAVQDVFHQDHRLTPKLLFEPAPGAPLVGHGADRAAAYLAQVAPALGLPAELSNLRLSRVRESLLGTHYTYQQQIDGIDVDRAEVTVSIARSGGRVYRVFNNTYPAKSDPPLSAKGAIDQEQAYDVAWNRLRAHGELLGVPAAKLAWVPEGVSFRLAWIIDLPLTDPYGGWEVVLDAQSGTVISTRDTNLYRKQDEFTNRSLTDRIDSYDGPIADRAPAMRAAAQAQAAHVARQSQALWGKRANGTGLVFDPDPRTTLQNDNLQDGSSAASFTAAYFTRGLLDISFDGVNYRLTGPWVDIIDWDTPTTPPSTTTTGNWTAVRGNNAFNDAMTYFQVDQNQRYMQDLGFTPGPMGIQDGPIGTDTDGFQGADNSFYDPGSNRMSFGHGCVDDNEDVDVIIHEYGHAINFSINPSWGGGDMGAMGEGFGDYWAGSYSFSTPNGPTYHPEWAFSWDGHGTGNPCWGGRILDALGAVYVHTTFYGAHTSIPGGYVSDELWSTPLFQTLLAMDALGHPREEVDTIILEAQFGLGSGLKMRDMANVILATATALYPAGPHATVFAQKFQVHDIIETLAAAPVAADPVVTTGGGNGAADPGETVQLQVPLTNDGNVTATAVSATLTSSTLGVVILQGASTYPDLAIGASAPNDTDYEILIPADHPCGDPVALSLAVSYDDGVPGAVNATASLPVGVPLGVSMSVEPNLPIPDANAVGVFSEIVVTGTGATATAGLNVDVDITHPWIGDLIVTLRSPSGTNVILHDRTGSSQDDIVGNYPLTLTPQQSLATLIGEPLDGTWRLTVSDNAGQDVGTLHAWGLHDVAGHECDEPTATPAAATRRFALHPNQPNPFNPTTTIVFEIPDAGPARLDVFDVAGRRVRTLVEGSLPAGPHSVSWNGKDDGNRPVASGQYFYRLDAGSWRLTRRMTLLK